MRKTLYYANEDNKDTLSTQEKALMGMNKIDCHIIILRFKEKEINTISFIEKPTSVFYPIEDIPAKELFLKGFRWEIEKKPSPVLTD
jgi:hypothetical protein